MENRPNKNLRIYIIVSTVALAASLLPASVMALFSPMMFDSPGSEENIITLSIVIGIISYPFVTVILGIIAWLKFTRKKHKPAAFLISIPYLHILSIMILFVLLEVLCDGNFSC